MLRFILAAALMFSTANSADAFTHGSAGGSPPPPVSCPQATDNGCSGANQNGSFININLLTTAQQSGQNSLLPTRAGGALTLNIPGVDYPIAYDSTIVLKNPNTINDSVCQWASTFLNCSSTGSGVVNEVLDGYDFSGTGGLFAVNSHVSAGSTLTITNSKFTIPASGGSGGAIGGNFSNLVFKYNQCDGTGATTASPFCLSSSATVTGTWDIEYNAFTNQGVGRIAGGLTNNNFILKYNYIQGLNNLSTANHGELMLRNCTGARKNCTAYDDYEGNFIVWDVPPTSGLNNATSFPGDGSSDGVILTSFTFSNNVVVTNKNGSTVVIDQSLMNARLSSLGVANMNGNWADNTGSNGCSINGVKSGGNSVTASQSGTVITITGLSSSFNNNPIEKGWQFFRSGVLVATITSLQSSIGNTGTVNVDTSASIGSDSSWTLVPGYISLTANDNYNLVSPGGAMNISGPQMTAAVCQH